MLVSYNILLQAYPILHHIEIKELYETLRSLSRNKNKKIAETASLYIRLSYIRKNVICLASARLCCACLLIERLEPNKKILIFGERISQSEELYQLLQEKFPGRVGRYHSQMGKQANKNIMERFQTGEIRILITCKSLDEGIDIPDISIGIILSGTSAQRQRIQRLGRIIRQKGKNETASLYYLHIPETSEEACFLPDTKNNHIFELKYSPSQNEFFHEIYDQAAEKLLFHMQDIGLEQEKLTEAISCLKLGKIRADWLSKHSWIEQQIKNAVYARDKNYWICMKKLQQFIPNNMIHKT